MSVTIHEWIDERQIAMDENILGRMDRFPPADTVMTSTDPQAKPPTPSNLWPVYEPDFGRRDWAREMFVTRMELTWGLR